MIYLKYILLLIIGISFCSNISDSLIIFESKDTVDKKAILIPDYHNNEGDHHIWQKDLK